MNHQRIRIWDLPTRLFHWTLVISVIAAIVTGKAGGNLMDWHGRIGILIVGLVAFRIVWGLLGSTYARFAQFLPTPAKINAYLRGELHTEGHNPLGALSVFALLAILLVQSVSGLVSNDDISFYGPLYDIAGRELSNKLTGIHHQLSNVLIALVALHVVAVLFYVVHKKQDLVKPMITGWKESAKGESARGGGIVAVLVALVVAGAAVYGASGAWITPPPPPPPVETPNW
ncbi:MAG TPA: cytochrome b/b6 domain-containing protein [Noviherbaspirillum sp.]|nr:cytochrome b/b6 domain-containing protein [Noviherbaspirillum sp.]